MVDGFMLICLWLGWDCLVKRGWRRGDGEEEMEVNQFDGIRVEGRVIVSLEKGKVVEDVIGGVMDLEGVGEVVRMNLKG